MKIILILLCASLVSCSTTRYGVDVSGGTAELVRSAEFVTLGGPNTKFKDVKLKGYGYKIGLSEETKYIIAKIQYSKESFKNFRDSYTIDAGDVEVEYKDTTQSGIEFSFGVKIKMLQVRLILGGKDLKFTTFGTKQTRELSYSGFGVGLETALSENGLLYIDYQSISGEPIEYAILGIRDEYKQTNILLGYRYNFATINWGAGWGEE